MPYKLAQYIRAEFAIFLTFLQLLIALKLVQSHGAPFGQLIHDGGTAENHKKYQAIAMQMVDPRWLCNLVICIGWVLCPSGVASDVASKIDETFHERTGYHTRDLCALVKAF